MMFRPGSWDHENRVFFDPATPMQRMGDMPKFNMPSFFKGLFG
jgi:hypothetical protein